MSFNFTLAISELGNTGLNFDSTATWIGTLAAAGGLIFTALQLRANNKTKQLEILETVYRDVRALEQRYYDEYQGKEGKDVKTWDYQFFNQLEWFSFLINEKKIKDEKLVNFFKPAIIEWYDKMFVKHFEESVINDKKQFEEFKKLYKKFKDKGE